MTKIVAAEYLKHFKCIGAACEDTCCAGWYIAIDENTYKKYKKVKNPVMKKRLDKELVAKKGTIDPEHAAKIKLKNNRCAFLSKEGWCDIYSELGEQYLSKTCTLYPRTINKIGDTLEHTLALSCPEACRVVLLNESGLKFEEGVPFSACTISGEVKLNLHKPQKWQDYVFMLRETMIKILQNRLYDIEKRFIYLTEFMEKLNYYALSGQLKKIPELVKSYQVGELYPLKDEPHIDLDELVALAGALKQIAEEKKWPSKRYESCYESMLRGIDFLESEDSSKAKAAVLKGYKAYYLPFSKIYDYILENYFVSYCFERLAPIDGQSPKESLGKLNLYKKLLTLHLIGMGNNRTGLEVEDVLLLIQSFTKTFDHNELYIHKLIKLGY